MLLAIDVGNSQVTCAIFNQNTMIYRFAFDINPSYIEKEIAMIILKELEAQFLISKVSECIISSVVRGFTDKIEGAVSQFLSINPIILKYNSNLGGIVLNVETPEEVGADRLCNIVGAKCLYSCPSIIVDMGTATTFDVLNSKEEFIGGAICPGIGMSLRALQNNTSLLPEVKPDYIRHAIARNTETNMLSGVLIGNAAMIDGMIDRMEEELGYKVKLIGTGGYFIYVKDHLKHDFDYVPGLTLQGLRCLHDLNK